MSDLTDKQQRHLDCLLKDYSSIKSEISQRSNFQRISLAAYIAIIALIGKVALTDDITSLYVFGIWFSSAITLSYFIRQGYEINRLGKIISERIAPVVSKNIDVDVKELFPSETNPGFNENDVITKRYNFHFKWALFFVTPLLISLLCFYQTWANIKRIFDFQSRAPYIAIFTAICIFWVVYLLIKHVNEKHDDA